LPTVGAPYSSTVCPFVGVTVAAPRKHIRDLVNKVAVLHQNTLCVTHDRNDELWGTASMTQRLRTVQAQPAADMA
jgi:hypothetical protein